MTKPIKLHAASYDLADLRKADPNNAADMVSDKTALSNRTKPPLPEGDVMAKVKDMSGNIVNGSVYISKEDKTDADVNTDADAANSKKVASKK